MKIIADLQIHSRYSRACSKDLIPENIGAWADKKGITVIGTGDFTHPKWRAELRDALVESEPGLFKLKSGNANARFMLTAEISNIYKQGEKVRRVHNMIFAPNFEAVEKLVVGLEARGANLKADGRPIMGLHCDELVRIVSAADEQMEVVPAHVWTPHFGLFGSLSGFDSVEEAFGDQSKYIWAIETGLSSDPIMNRTVSAFDKYTLTSNSDAHSLRKIGREANVFEIEEKKLSYSEIIRVMKENKPEEFLYTIEFFPGEGKYHLDGHADCKFSCEPAETKRLGGLCPVCGKKLLVGVLSRVYDLADREAPKEELTRFRNVVPLEEVIAATLGVGVGSKKVQAAYESAVEQHTEFYLLLDAAEHVLVKALGEVVATAVGRMRRGEVVLEGGYDGVFGKVELFSDSERAALMTKRKQQSLFN